MLVRLRALLELARVSNLPTVWSQVLVGVALGTWGGDRSVTLAGVLGRAWPLMVAMSLVYAGGMVLNDVADAKVDAVERPRRPIPSGRFGRLQAGLVGAGLLGAALLAAAIDYGPAVLPWMGGLVACVLAYDLLHKSGPWAVLLMASCRALVVLSAAAVGGAVANGWLAAALAGALTLMLSLVARGEMQPGRRWHRGVAVLIALLPWVLVFFHPWEWRMAALALPSLLLFAPIAWLGRATPIAIGGWIAGMAALDAAILWTWGWPWLALGSLGAWGLTLAGQRFIKGS